MLYKLTTQDGRTRVGYPNETRWGENVEHEATGPEGRALCSDSWIHAYTDPLLAVFLNPIHADISKPVLWEAEGVVGKSDGLKVGCRKLKTVRKIDLPAVTTEQRVKFAILCAKQVCKDEQWNAWADKWLSGEDRSKKVAAEAARAKAAWTAAAAVEAAPIDLAAIAKQAVEG